MIEIEIRIGGQPLVAELDDDALAAIAAAVAPTQEAKPNSPYMTIPEAAEYLRCKRQRIDDLLSTRRLERLKDGSRTLIRRSDLDAYLTNGGNGSDRR